MQVLIIPLGGKYYRASAWESTTNVLTERTYSHITLTCGGSVKAAKTAKRSEKARIYPSDKYVCNGKSQRRD